MSWVYMMKGKYKMRTNSRLSSIKVILSVVMLLTMMILMQTASVYANAQNTDTDEDRDDGQYTFIKNGDTYGWNSYLYNDGENHHVSARYYYVTLPEDGRLNIEVTGEQSVYFRVIIQSANDSEGSYYKEWDFSDEEKPLSFNTSTGVLEKGTYVATFAYNLGLYLGPMQTWPGRHEFYHNLTFHTLNAEEKAAMNVVKSIEALPDSVALADKEKVQAALDAYNGLTDVQRGYISDKDIEKLKSAVSAIEEYEKQEAEKKKEQNTPQPDFEPSWEELIDDSDSLLTQALRVTAPKMKNFKAAKLRKAGKSFRAIHVSGAEGKVTYKATGNRKSKKALKFNKKTKKITVKKGTKRGKYALTITVKADGGSNYHSASKKVKITVKVK